MLRPVALLSLVLITGCAPTQNYYRTADGLRADANPAAFKKYEVDRAICNGETAKAALAGQYPMEGYRVAMVERGCMAEKGYIAR